MRRKILFPAFFYLSGIIVYVNFNEKASVFNAFTVLLTVCLSLILIKTCYEFSTKQCAVLLVVFAYGIMNSFYFVNVNQKPLQNLETKPHNYVLKVEKIEEREGRVDIIGQVKYIDDRAIRFSPRILVKCYDYTLEESLIDDYISVTGEICEPKPNTNPHCFNYKEYLMGKGIFYELSCNSFKVLQGTDSIKKAIVNWKKAFFYSMSTKYSALSFGLIKGICFGEKNDIDEDNMRLFRENGTAHVLAVSGLHIGLIYACLKKLLFKKHKYLFYFSTILILFVYGTITQWSVSVIRASLLIGISMLSFVVEKRFDVTCGTVGVGLLMLVINPFQILNSGFQMSFLAVLSLSFFSGHTGKVVEKCFSRLEFKGKESLCKSLTTVFSIQLGLGIFMVYTFNYFSFNSFLINIPTVMIVSLLVPMVLIQFLGFILTGIIVCDELTEIICQVLSELNQLAWSDGVFTANATSFSPVAVGGFILLVFYFASEIFAVDRIRGNRKRILLSSLLIILVSITLFVDKDREFNGCDMIFVDVGQGDCLHIRHNGNNYLIDGGGKADYNLGLKTLKPYLLKNGVASIDMAIATHNHNDHYLGLKELSVEIPIERGVLSSGYFNGKENIEKEFVCNNYNYVNNTKVIRIDDDFSIEVLWPEENAVLRDEEDENEVSLVLMVNFQGIKTLVTGDIDSQCEENLLKKYGGTGKLKCNILKVAHHGSKYSSSEKFLDAVNPDISIISVGKNNYGHPDDGVIERLKNMGSKVYRTDKEGAIGINLNNMKVCTIKKWTVGSNGSYYDASNYLCRYGTKPEC